MRELFADLDRWQGQEEEIALATLVGVRGSAPRLPGARLFLARSGKMAGSISGGCVENDVFERAMQVLESGQSVVASYGIADELGFQVGLSCGGSIEVLIERFVACEAWQALRQATENQQPAAFSIGLAPPPLRGRKLTVVGDETVAGSIDPSLDSEVIAAAHRLLPQGGTRLLNLPGSHAAARVFVEAFPPPLRLLIVGATHTATHLCRMAKELGFRVSVIDARSTFATAERFPEADEVLQSWPDQELDRTPLDDYSYVVTLTHDPKFDLPTLARALRSRARYVGALGSRRTHERRRAQLQRQGFTDAELDRIRAPIGLDIGGRTPQETAVSILAEILAVRYGRDGRALTQRRAPIHADN